MKTALSFDDVLLVPKYSEIDTRSKITLSQEVKYVGHIRLPIISSPMDTVTEASMALKMHQMGAFGIIHRYNTIQQQAELAREVVDQAGDCGAAIGINDDFLERAIALTNAGVGMICIDVAHGHHYKVRYALEALRNTLGTSVHIMAGNVATLQGFNDLADWGADSIRIGIGGGSICSTRIQTGHGMPTLQSVMDCAQSDRDALLIADGGIRTSGDIVKALAAGADFVMLGSLLAGTEETPGKCFQSTSGERRKVYRGMASPDAQHMWRKKVSSVEGISSSVPYKGSVSDTVKLLETGIRSGVSYTGALSIAELRDKATMIRQTPAGQVESTTHIKGRK
jgi:IMP dehydrogenase